MHIPHPSEFRRLLERLERFAVAVHVVDIVLGLCGLSIVGVALSAYHAYKTQHLNQRFLLGTILLFLFFSLVPIYMAVAVRRRTLQTQNPFVEEVYRKIIFYIGKRKCREEVELQLKALAQGIHYYWLQYSWSGSGDATLTSETAGVQISGPISTNGSDLNYFLLTFENTIPTKRIFHINLVYDLLDPDLHAKPFLGVLAPPRRKKFQLNVVFPGYPLPQVNYFIRKTTRDLDRLGEPMPYEFPLGSMTATWDVSEPKRGRHYSITWPKEYILGLPDDED